MNDLVELVPNISEGRDLGRVGRLARLVGEAGCHLLDVHHDAAHHRSVFTAAGSSAAAVGAAGRLARGAVESIDLTRHRGLHPRFGAVDVIPFVRIRGSEAELVRRVDAAARQIAEVLQIPVFLYARSSPPGETRRLSPLRRGGFERLDERLRDGELVPDFGPRRAHPTAGAIAMGVRDFLIAFNVFLETERVASARAIATRVRESSGGLPAVQAIGRFHDGESCAQVSMNLLNYRTPSLPDIYDAVSELARDEGIEVRRSEIVGLVPKDAWQPEWQEHLRLPEPARTIEEALSKAGLS